jgi:lysozyme family protein
MAKSEILVPFIKSWEGKFVNDPNDRGGATMMGVTIATFRSVFGATKTVEDLKRITPEQWHTIFKRYYWDKWKADSINSQSIANLLVDWYWASGSYGTKIPQSVLKVKVDGVIGPKTIAAINDYPNEKELFVKLWKEREAFFQRIAKGSQKKFLNGWLNRLNGIRYGKLVCNGGKVIDY